jgi:hypothetical protein
LTNVSRKTLHNSSKELPAGIEVAFVSPSTAEKTVLLMKNDSKMISMSMNWTYKQQFQAAGETETGRFQPLEGKSS